MNIDQSLRAAAEPVPSRVARPPARKLLDDIVHSDPSVALTAAARTPAARTPTAHEATARIPTAHEATARTPAAREAAARTPVAPAPAALSARRRRFPRLAVAGSALILVAATVAVVNGLGPGRAYASWTPDPAPLPAADARAIVDRCVPTAERPGARVAIGEARGRYAYLDVLTADGSRTCFRDHDGDVRQSSVLVGPAGAAQLGRTGIEMYGWGQLRTDEGYARLMSGRLGSRIRKVDIVVRGRDGSSRTVHATVRDNFFAAWYPEGKDEASTNRATLTLTRADGTTESGLAASVLLDQPRLDTGSGE
ncbi:hypothetical protein [Actinoplanes sp. NPDC049265]|uniref:hypothetical protein n=1 Tax=Actinoplanes sp. NPDC049265 TaxID=3363902 RepID=UPI00372024F0